MNEKLNLWLSSFRTVKEAANKIGVSESAVNCWMSGRRNPSTSFSYKIQSASEGYLTVSELRPKKSTCTKCGRTI